MHATDVPISDTVFFAAQTLAIWLRAVEGLQVWNGQIVIRRQVLTENHGNPTRTREPFLKAPWPVTVLVFTLLVVFTGQSLFPQEQILPRWAFSGANLRAGRWDTAFTAILLHGSWAHVLMNCGGALAFATPVVRTFGTRARGLVGFVAFFLISGALANLAHLALDTQGTTLLVGASGAISAMMGASASVVGGGGRPGPILSPPVLSLGGGWLAVNLLIAVLGFAPGFAGVAVAWDVHIAGFVIGVLLIGPLVRLFTPR